MTCRYLIEKNSDRIMSYLLGGDGRAVEIHADPLSDGLKAGDICIGRIERILAATGACFVTIAPGIRGYLPFEEMAGARYTRKGSSGEPRQGDELIVQISREAIGSKEMALTARLQLKGRYTVLEACGTGLGVSRKIPEERRKDLREHLLSGEMLDDIRQRIGACGIVVRTNAEHAPDGIIRKELSELTSSMQHLLLTAPYRPASTVLYRQPDRWLSRTDALPVDDTEQILTDDPELYQKLASYLAPPLSERLRLYRDPMISMHSVFSLTRELSRALCRRVNLKSGANLVIDRTEALTAIDVNSAHFIKGKDKEEAVLKVNLEAADECARQIRLRNLSGMILIDFINMEHEDSYDILLDRLRSASFRDPMHVEVVDRTALGLVEMTRRRIEPPLGQVLNPRRMPDASESVSEAEKPG